MFIENARWQPRNCLKMPSVLLVTASLCLFSQAASATDVPVYCNSDDAISQTLGSLGVVGPHVITVSGACFDSVHISQWDLITIKADPVLGASISPPFGSQYAIVIDSSRSILLQGLTITNSVGNPDASGIWITNNSNVVIQNSTIENSPSDGIRVSENSLVSITNTVIQNHIGTGLVIENGSVARLLGEEDNPVNINNNRNRGIELSAGTLRSAGSLIVESNREGLFLGLGSHARINSEAGYNSFSSNTLRGVYVLTGSTIEFAGSNIIANNGYYGVQVQEGGTARFDGSLDPEGGEPIATIIEGNRVQGLFLFLDSGATFWGPHQIRGNGSGVYVGNNSSFVAQGGTDISNNFGIGVQTEIDASTSFNGATITNNDGEGLVLRRMAVAEFWNQPTTISDNGIADLTCDDSSFAFGELGGVVVNECKREKKDK